MTTYMQFCTGAKMRHDFGDMIQVRYAHPNGESFDTWISGEEVMARLKTMSREALIESFSRKNWGEAKAALQREAATGRQNLWESLRDKLGDSVEKNVGAHIFGRTLARKVRGDEPENDPRAAEKARWQQRLHNDAFRTVALDLAWIHLEGTMPPEATSVPNDWV